MRIGCVATGWIFFGFNCHWEKENPAIHTSTMFDFSYHLIRYSYTSIGFYIQNIDPYLCIAFRTHRASNLVYAKLFFYLARKHFQKSLPDAFQRTRVQFTELHYFPPFLICVFTLPKTPEKSKGLNSKLIINRLIRVLQNPDYIEELRIKLEAMRGLKSATKVN
ncbi:MAG: hypothetical protein A2V69_02715 [Candidatus Portnoybacteria bacterium RBG_13_40_8]|uniref:Uncharacterized protein n=1 Tax=Candidatus Portnoybacteria bacterium RBG_13_40_8 TaxID=1801990 RepID=A0A1G2F5N7_9BACT|nr:MAG: hypothetical protein A2V69_02715 [Candidatus Portnoybacteria bacterium RBG_13_40_8]OGZ35453.1 MAG: hypothetical protein A2V60_03390 [Candidatus Portnoybacteria bacterium RIFCSPHIGHO2_01_FULL_39_19]